MQIDIEKNEKVGNKIFSMSWGPSLSNKIEGVKQKFFVIKR